MKQIFKRAIALLMGLMLAAGVFMAMPNRALAGTDQEDRYHGPYVVDGYKYYIAYHIGYDEPKPEDALVISADTARNIAIQCKDEYLKTHTSGNVFWIWHDTNRAYKIATDGSDVDQTDTDLDTRWNYGYVYKIVKESYDSTVVSNSSGSHIHQIVSQTIYAPTELTDGRAGMVCSECGYIESAYIIPKESAIIYNRYQQIDAAKAGQIIKLEMGNLNSFSQEFMTKIANKTAQNVNFLIHFDYNHVRYEVSIPAGTAVDTTSCVWYGPEKMMQLYSTTEVK